MEAFHDALDSCVTQRRRFDGRPISRSIPAMIEEAKELGINISRACEEGLAKQISEERGRRWLEENREAIDGWNAWVAGARAAAGTLPGNFDGALLMCIAPAGWPRVLLLDCQADRTGRAR